MKGLSPSCGHIPGALTRLLFESEHTTSICSEIASALDDLIRVEVPDIPQMCTALPISLFPLLLWVVGYRILHTVVSRKRLEKFMMFVLYPISKCKYIN